jgi:hypothetical protein
MPTTWSVVVSHVEVNMVKATNEVEENEENVKKMK